MNGTRELLLPRLCSRADGYFPELATEPPPCRAEVVFSLDRVNSSVMKVSLAKGQTRRIVYVKTLADTPAARGVARARYEYDSLRGFAPKLAARSGRLLVPEPLDLFDDAATLVTRELEGRSLEHLIARAARRGIGIFSRRDAQTFCRLTGEWLAAFHSLEQLQADKPALLGRVVDDACRRLDSIRPHVGAAALLDRIAGRIRQESSRLPVGSLDVVPRHNDFAPRNVVAAPGRVGVLDFEDWGPGFAYEDLMRFGACLETMPRFPYVSKAAVAALHEQFLAGYRGTRTIDPEALRVFRLIGMAWQFGSEVSSLAGRPGAPARRAAWIRRFVVKSYIAWFDKEL